MYNKQLKKNTKLLSFWIHLEAIDLTNRKLTNPKNVKKKCWLPEHSMETHRDFILELFFTKVFGNHRQQSTSSLIYVDHIYRPSIHYVYVYSGTPIGRI
jgi:hypothetical protein